MEVIKVQKTVITKTYTAASFKYFYSGYVNKKHIFDVYILDEYDNEVDKKTIYLSDNECFSDDIPRIISIRMGLKLQ